MVFCGLFPVDATDFAKLSESITRLRLHDASFTSETETKNAAYGCTVWEPHKCGEERRGRVWVINRN